MKLIAYCHNKIEISLINIYFLLFSVNEATDIDKYYEIRLFIFWNMVKL